MNFSNEPSDQWNWEPKHAECYLTDIETAGFMVCVSIKMTSI